MRINRAVLVDGVVRADLALDGGQQFHRRLGIRHAGVVHHQDVDRAAVDALVEIGRWPLDDFQTIGSCTTLGSRSEMMATPASVITPPRMMRQVNSSPSNMTLNITV